MEVLGRNTVNRADSLATLTIREVVVKVNTALDCVWVECHARVVSGGSQM